MGPVLAQSVTVDNRGGAGGILGADVVAKPGAVPCCLTPPPIASWVLMT